MNFCSITFFKKHDSKKLVTNYFKQRAWESKTEETKSLKQVTLKDTKYSLLLKLYMFSAFSIRTIQQCSIPSLFLDGPLKKGGKKYLFFYFKGEKMFDVRMVSHESKWKIKLSNKEFLKAKENPFKGIQFKGKSPWLFFPNCSK